MVLSPKFTGFLRCILVKSVDDWAMISWWKRAELLTLFYEYSWGYHNLFKEYNHLSVKSKCEKSSIKHSAFGILVTLLFITINYGDKKSENSSTVLNESLAFLNQFLSIHI